MSGAEIALIITALATLGGLFVNAQKIVKLQEERKNDQLAIEHNRESLIRIGEQLSITRQDNAQLALLVKQLFEQYQEATGHKPAIDWKNFDTMLSLKYITGPLIGRIEIKDK